MGTLGRAVRGVGGVVAASLLTACFGARVLPAAVTGIFRSPRAVVEPAQVVRPDARLSVTWIGHATALVQIDDKVFLTDPVLTDTVGQLSKRRFAPGVAPDRIPHVDAVVVSHLHFDHLSLGTLAMLERRIGALLLPPSGLSYLTDFRFPAYELGAWQSYSKDGVTVTAVPVEHMGFRYGIDRDFVDGGRTGYVIGYHGMQVYFGGDTAYKPQIFVQVAERMKPIDVAILPIAPIEPRGFMRRVHMGPEEALQAFVDLRAKWMVPVHFDTFVDSLDEPGDAAEALTRAARARALPSERVALLPIGGQRVFVSKPAGAPGASATPHSSSVKPATGAPEEPPALDDDDD